MSMPTPANRPASLAEPQAQLAQVAAYRDRLSAQIAAFKALGGGYAEPQRQARAS